MLPIKQLSSVTLRLLQLHTDCIHRYLKICCIKKHSFNTDSDFQADPKVLALRDKLLHCDYLDYEKIRVGYLERRLKKLKADAYRKVMTNRKLTHEPVYSVVLENRFTEGEEGNEGEYENTDMEEKRPIHMPYASVDHYETVDSTLDDREEMNPTLLNEKYKVLYEKYLEAKSSRSKTREKIDFEDYVEDNACNLLPKGELWKVPPEWMTDYEQYDDTLMEEDWEKNYGTPDPNSKVSSVPCGGCGALLHCRDPAIPGYLPSELFLHRDNEDLKLMACQRCHFLKFYNAALEVKVSIEEYPKLLQVIKTKKCAVILMVDLTDFPCSIWPDIKNVLHPLTPIFLVGNKVDLLPPDSSNCLDHIQNQLLNTVHEITGIRKEMIVHVQLISAKTGYGVENLINKLQNKWRHKGDVYLVGCTNVGKSSLFNTLLNSDYCKVQAVDLVQRATISPWPGTTLNLLKFPILNPNGERLYLRMMRLKSEQKFQAFEKVYKREQFKSTRNLKYATLQDRIGRTFSNRSLMDEKSDPFSAGSHRSDTRKFGLDERRAEYQQSRWCYDTPGTIQSDQVLDLLTTEELLATLPNKIISPRTFVFKPGQTMFLAGLGRLDYVEGQCFMRCTLFASRELPMTICFTVDADEVYNALLQTEAFIVPENSPERLKAWPALESKELQVTGIDNNESAADVVLSSAGWVAVTPREEFCATLKAWTPQGRGIHLRTPALLRKAVCLRGKRVKSSPVYRFGRQAYV